VPDWAEPTPMTGGPREGELTIEARHEAACAAARLVPVDNLDLAHYALGHLRTVMGLEDDPSMFEAVEDSFTQEFFAKEGSGYAVPDSGGDPWASAESPASGSEVEATSPHERSTAEVGQPERPAPDQGEKTVEGEGAPVDRASVPQVSQHELALRHVMAEYPTLRHDQGGAIAGILTSGRGVDMLVGPAGSGKSYVLAKLAEVWKERTDTPVTGLAP